MLPQTRHPTTLSVLSSDNATVINVLVDMVIYWFIISFIVFVICSIFREKKKIVQVCCLVFAFVLHSDDGLSEIIVAC